MLTQDEESVKARTAGLIHRQRRHDAARANPTTRGVARRPQDHDAEIEADDWLQARRITSRRGNLLYVKIGRRRLITRQHLEQFLGVAS